MHQPLNEEKRAVLEAKRARAAARARRRGRERRAAALLARLLGRARAVANRAFAETIQIEADGHGNGHHGNGHEVTGQEHEAVGATGSTALPPGEGGER